MDNMHSYSFNQKVFFFFFPVLILLSSSVFGKKGSSLSNNDATYSPSETGDLCGLTIVKKGQLQAVSTAKARYPWIAPLCQKIQTDCKDSLSCTIFSRCFPNVHPANYFFDQERLTQCLAYIKTNGKAPLCDSLSCELERTKYKGDICKEVEFSQLAFTYPKLASFCSKLSYLRKEYNSSSCANPPKPSQKDFCSLLFNSKTEGAPCQMNSFDPQKIMECSNYYEQIAYVSLFSNYLQKDFVYETLSSSQLFNKIFFLLSKVATNNYALRAAVTAYNTDILKNLRKKAWIEPFLEFRAHNSPQSTDTVLKLRAALTLIKAAYSEPANTNSQQRLQACLYRTLWYFKESYPNAKDYIENSPYHFYAPHMIQEIAYDKTRKETIRLLKQNLKIALDFTNKLIELNKDSSSRRAIWEVVDLTEKELFSGNPPLPATPSNFLPWCEEMEKEYGKLDIQQRIIPGLNSYIQSSF